MSRLRTTAVALVAALLLTLVAAAAAGAATPRIVALTPFQANTLMALDVKPVAIGALPSGETKISKRLKDVKRLALNHSTGGPNLEELALLNPQLVLSSPIWNKSAAGMRELGIQVVMSDPQRVADVARQTELIGQLVGRRKEAERYAAFQRKNVRVAVKRIKRHPKVLLVLGIGQRVLAFMPDSWGGDLVKTAGGRLLTEGITDGTISIRGFATIQAEKVRTANPDVIIAVPHGSTQNMAETVKSLRGNLAWKGTNAQRNGRIYVSTDNSLLQAWETAATSIHDVQTKYLRNR